MFRNSNFKEKRFFFLLIFLSVFFTYWTHGIVPSIFYIAVLILYANSNNEPFWLAFFLVLSDGFLGFFGSYEATLSLLPGLPSIEVGQFYILIMLIKATSKKPHYTIFYRKQLIFMGFYLILLLFLGFAIGIRGGINVYFRVFKLTFPLLLFYSVPILFKTKYEYSKFFSFIFPIALLAFFSQVFDIVFGYSITTFLGAKNTVIQDISEDQAYRGFYNASIILLSMFGSLYFLQTRKRVFNSFYLYSIFIASFLIAFFSATRGWIIGFGLVISLYFIFISKVRINKLVVFLIFGFIGYNIVFSVPIVSKQAQLAWERLTTVEEIAEGDLSAGGTNIRLTERGPRVIGKWQDSKVFGWGFSSDFFEYADGHVGNQNILLNSGLVGLLLMILFFIYFNYVLLEKGVHSSKKELLVFPVFFVGWFIIHSTSTQIFSYYAMPNIAMVEAVFFSFGALEYHQTKYNVQ